MSNQPNPNSENGSVSTSDDGTNSSTTNNNTRVRIPVGGVPLSNSLGEEELVSRVADLFSHLAIRDVLGSELPEGMVLRLDDIDLTPTVPGLYTPPNPSTSTGLGTWLRSASFELPPNSSSSSSSSSSNSSPDNRSGDMDTDTDTIGSTNAVIDDAEQAFINRLLNQEGTDCVLLPTNDEDGDETDDDDDVTIISVNGAYSGPVSTENTCTPNHINHENDDKQPVEPMPMVCGDSGASLGNQEPISAMHYIMDPSMVDNTIASEFTCAICKLILDRPCEISVCGHTFCGECITKWINVSAGTRVVKCPECKVELQPNYINPSKKNRSDCEFHEHQM